MYLQNNGNGLLSVNYNSLVISTFSNKPAVRDQIPCCNISTFCNFFAAKIMLHKKYLQFSTLSCEILNNIFTIEPFRLIKTRLKSHRLILGEVHPETCI